MKWRSWRQQRWRESLWRWRRSGIINQQYRSVSTMGENIGYLSVCI